MATRLGPRQSQLREPYPYPIDTNGFMGIHLSGQFWQRHCISEGVVGGAITRVRRHTTGRSTMRYLRQVALLGVLVALAGVMAGTASAQVRVGVGIGIGLGPAPVCAYGYYPSYPYACAPYGYYGPDWFVNGVFIGAGPWFHGFWGRPGYFGRPIYGHGPVVERGSAGRAFVGRGFAPGRTVGRGPTGGFRGGAGFHGGGFHGGGGFHVGGRR